MTAVERHIILDFLTTTQFPPSRQPRAQVQPEG
jgi:hypothetical protein